jgi:hypothetical protein
MADNSIHHSGSIIAYIWWCIPHAYDLGFA